MAIGLRTGLLGLPNKGPFWPLADWVAKDAVFGRVVALSGVLELSHFLPSLGSTAMRLILLQALC